MELVAVGDIIEFKDYQALLNIAGEVLNVYHYRVRTISGTTLISDDVDGWVTAFQDSIFEALLPIQTTSLTHVRLDINNLMAYTTDFGTQTYPTPIAGQVAGDYASAATAWSFILFRTTRVTRHGHKRIPGVPDSWVQNNVVSTDFIDELANYAAAIQVPMVFTVDGTVTVQMDPVIIRKPVLSSVPPTVVNLVSDAAYRGIGTQNTRKQLL